MKITLVCNCGLLLECGVHKLLIDAPNGPLPPYYEFPEAEFQKLIAVQPPYDGSLAFAFTHTHSDHFCRDKLRRVLGARPQTKVFLPDEAAPDAGAVQLGGFTIEFYRFLHMPVPKNLAVDHFVLLVRYGGETVYITADAQTDADLHRAILAGRRCDAAFWNGLYLSYEQTRELLHEAANQNYIYHVPIDPRDVSGIRRKCERNMMRHSSELSGVTVLSRYPAELWTDEKGKCR